MSVDITDPAEQAYSRWIRALFDRVAHGTACIDGCRPYDELCDVGLTIAAVEQTQHRVWRVTATQEAAS